MAATNISSKDKEQARVEYGTVAVIAVRELIQRHDLGPAKGVEVELPLSVRARKFELNTSGGENAPLASIDNLNLCKLGSE